MKQGTNRLLLSKICEDTQLEKLYKEANDLYKTYNEKIKKASKIIRKFFTFEDFYSVYVQFYVYSKRINSGQSIKQAVQEGLKIFLGNPNFLLLSFAKLKRSNSNSFESGAMLTENVTLGGIRKLSHELKSSSYIPNPVRKIKITTSDEKNCFLGIGNTKDQIVQEAIKILIEPVFEHDFLRVSYGFRPGKNCHSALSEIEKRWKRVAWFIECEIVQTFERKKYSILLNLIRIKIQDFVVVSILKKLLKAGYILFNDLGNSRMTLKEETLQRSALSAILCNIYFHELDQFVVNVLIPRWNMCEKIKSKIDRSHKRLICCTYVFWKSITKGKIFQTVKSKLRGLRIKYLMRVTLFNYRDNAQKRALHYVRYADGFILGFMGAKADALTILQQICAYLEIFLNSQLNTVNSMIKHFEEGVVFLGYHLFGSYGNKIPFNKFHRQQIIRNEVKFGIPIKRLLKSYAEKGFCQVAKKGKNDKYVARRMDKWLFLNHDAEVVRRFNVLARGIAEYYSGSDFPAALSSIWFLLERSLALTLAHRHKQRSAKWAYKRFGNCLEIKISAEKAITWVKPTVSRKKWKIGKSLQGQLSTVIAYKFRRTSTPRVMGNVKITRELECAIPNCLNVAEFWYHARYKKKSKISSTQKLLQDISVKQIPLCKKHYVSIQTGKYDGPSLKKLMGFSIDTKIDFFDVGNKNF